MLPLNRNYEPLRREAEYLNLRLPEIYEEKEK